jgi:transposase
LLGGSVVAAVSGCTTAASPVVGSRAATLASPGLLEALRLLVDRRGELSRTRIQCVNRVHRLLAELVPGQSKKNVSTAQAKRILATVKPRDPAGRTRRRRAAEQVAELVVIEQRFKAVTRELKGMVTATGQP